LFRVTDDGWPGGADGYWLYGGSAAPAAPLADPAEVYLFYEDFESYAAEDEPTDGLTLAPADAWRVRVDETGNRWLEADAPAQSIVTLSGVHARDIVVGASVWFQGATRLNRCGVFARAQSAAPYELDLLTGELQYWSDVVAVSRYETGLASTIDWTPYSLPRAPVYELYATFTGDLVQVDVDDVPTVITSLPFGSIGEAGAAGLVCDDPHVWFDHLWARRYTEPEPVAALGLVETDCD
jgi:hypothetical protein